MATVYIPPFPASAELVPDATPTTQGVQPIPNEPHLDSAPSSIERLLHDEVACDVLDELYPYLFLIAKKSSTHIDPLHDHIGKGRTVTITERPNLHLVWYYKIFYTKPLPHYLLNFSFWQRYLQPRHSESPKDERPCYAPSALSPTCKAALGFLRTYGYLIRHESDFRMAKVAGLLPENVTYTAFQTFIEPFRHLPDEAVSLRYHYGQIRMTRLNYAVRLLRPKTLGRTFPWYYRNLWSQSGQYFERFVAPLLLLFASLTLILSSMQVVLAAQAEDTWVVFSQVSWGFSVAIIVFIVSLTIGGFLLFLWHLCRQLTYGIQMQRRGWREKSPVDVL